MSRVMVEEPISDEERLAVAKKFVDEMKMSIPAVVDSIGDETGTAYAAHPDRLYLVGKDGLIAWAGDKGPMGFSVDKLMSAIAKELGKSDNAISGDAKADSTNQDIDSAKAKASQERSSQARRSGRPGNRSSFLMSMPFMVALDADKDGKLSASEIENAPSAIGTLDKDQSGTITPEELLPKRGQGRR